MEAKVRAYQAFQRRRAELGGPPAQLSTWPLIFCETTKSLSNGNYEIHYCNPPDGAKLPVLSGITPVNIKVTGPPWDQGCMEISKADLRKVEERMSSSEEDGMFVNNHMYNQY